MYEVSFKQMNDKRYSVHLRITAEFTPTVGAIVRDDLISSSSEWVFIPDQAIRVKFSLKMISDICAFMKEVCK